MTEEEARKMVKNVTVMWDNNEDILGTVRILSSGGFFVDWEDGQKGWIAYDCAQSITIQGEVKS